jgi:hypothetical protein
MVRLASTVCPICPPPLTLDVPSATSADKTLITKVRVTTRVPFSLFEPFFSFFYGHGLSYLPSLLTSLFPLLVLIRVVRFTVAVSSVGTFVTPTHVTCTAIADITFVAVFRVTT